jgi:hypothetical protein
VQLKTALPSPVVSATQVPLCWQGLLVHTSSVVEQVTPTQSSLHAQRNASTGIGGVEDELESEHTPPFWHGFDEHSSTSSSHASPVQPAAQTHENPLSVVVHAPSFWHGFGSQWSSFVSH